MDENPVVDARGKLRELTYAEIGHAVMAWSQVEISTDTALTSLLYLNGTSMASCKLIALNLGVREKCTIIACLAHEVHSSQKWLDALLIALNTISHDLRNRRNRLLHDTWEVKDQFVVRTTRTPLRVSRPQSRTFSIDIPGPQEDPYIEAHAFGADCQKAVLTLNNLMLSVLRDARKEPPEAAPEQSPRRRKFWSRLLRLRS